jgi:hypothetical protein
MLRSCFLAWHRFGSWRCSVSGHGDPLQEGAGLPFCLARPVAAACTRPCSRLCTARVQQAPLAQQHPAFAATKPCSSHAQRGPQDPARARPCYHAASAVKRTPMRATGKGNTFSAASPSCTNAARRSSTASRILISAVARLAPRHVRFPEAGEGPRRALAVVPYCCGLQARRAASRTAVRTRAWREALASGRCAPCEAAAPAPNTSCAPGALAAASWKRSAPPKMVRGSGHASLVWLHGAPCTAGGQRNMPPERWPRSHCVRYVSTSAGVNAGARARRILHAQTCTAARMRMQRTGGGRAAPGRAWASRVALSAAPSPPTNTLSQGRA